MADGQAIQEIIQSFQQLLEAQIDSAAQRMVDSYGRIYQSLEKEQTALLQEMQHLRDIGQTPTRAMIHKDARYKELLVKTEEQMQKYAVIIEDNVSAGYADTAAMGARQGEVMMEAQVSVFPEPIRGELLGMINRMSESTIAAMVGALQEDSPLWRITLKSFGAETARDIGDALVRNILKGKNPITTAREMQKTWGVPLTRAVTISRTEHLRAHRMASMASYRNNADVVQGWTWNANLDTDTCPACIALHGTKHGLDETLDDHPNGRCYATPITPSWKDLGFEGLPETGAQTPEGAGEEWFGGLSEEKQRDILGDAKWQAWKGGQFQFNQLAQETHSEDWGRSFRVASLEELGIEQRGANAI